MANQPKKSSAMPLVIIGIVLVLAVGGFAWLYSTSQPQPAANRTNQSTANAARTPAASAANAPPGAAIGINMLGQPTATVTVEEFADFQCPSCAATHPIMKDVQAAFAGNKNVKFVFRHYPLPIHDKSYDAAVVTEAAGMQGGPKFWSMLDQLMTNQQAWASAPNYRELWKQYAERIGLDVAKWESDSAGIAAKGRVDLDRQRAQGLGVGSTPSIYINNRLVPFAEVKVASLRQLIETEIETTTKTSAPAANAPATNAANAAK